MTSGKRAIWIVATMVMVMVSCEDAVVPVGEHEMRQFIPQTQDPQTQDPPVQDPPVKDPPVKEPVNEEDDVREPGALAAEPNILPCTAADAEIAKPPEPPINLRGLAIGTTGFELRWDRALYHEDHWFAITFNVARMNGSTWDTLTSAGYRHLYYRGTAPAGNQTFRVTGVNRCSQESSNGTTVVVAIGSGGPTPAKWLTGTTVGEHTVDLRWRVDRDEGGVVFQVERRSNESSPWVQISSLDRWHGWHYTDRGLDSGSTHQYRVWSARPDLSETTGFKRASASTDVVTVTTWPTGSTRMPSAPRMFRVIETTVSSIRMAWLAPESDGNSRLTGYTLQRYDDDDDDWTKLVDLNSDQITYTHTGLVKDTRYRYRVRAKNEKVLTESDGNWTNSSFRTDPVGQPSPLLHLAGQQFRGRVEYIHVGWEMPEDWFENPDGHNQADIRKGDYTVQRKVNDGSWADFEVMDFPIGRWAFTMQMTGIQFDTDYSFRVKYKNSPWSNVCTISFTDTVTGSGSLQTSAC